MGGIFIVENHSYRGYHSNGTKSRHSRGYRHYSTKKIEKDSVRVNSAYSNPCNSEGTNNIRSRGKLGGEGTKSSPYKLHAKGILTSATDERTKEDIFGENIILQEGKWYEILDYTKYDILDYTKNATMLVQAKCNRNVSLCGPKYPSSGYLLEGTYSVTNKNGETITIEGEFSERCEPIIRAIYLVTCKKDGDTYDLDNANMYWSEGRKAYGDVGCDIKPDGTITSREDEC